MYEGSYRRCDLTVTVWAKMSVFESMLERSLMSVRWVNSLSSSESTASVVFEIIWNKWWMCYPLNKKRKSRCFEKTWDVCCPMKSSECGLGKIGDNGRYTSNGNKWVLFYVEVVREKVVQWVYKRVSEVKTLYFDASIGFQKNVKWSMLILLMKVK